MNNIFSPSLKVIILSLVFSLAGIVLGQDSGPYTAIKVVKNTVNHSYSFASDGPPTVIATPKRGTASLINIGGVNRQLVYSPNSGFIGMDTLVIETLDQFNNSKYIGIVIEVNNSFISTVEDFAIINSNGTLLAQVLQNDQTTSGGLKVSKVLNATNGIAIPATNNQNIQFNPKSGFSGQASVAYQACDSSGTCAIGTLSIFVRPTSLSSYSVNIVTIKNNSVKVHLPDQFGYTVSGNPTNGTASIQNGVLTYNPNSGFSGTDIVTAQFIQNGNPVVTTINITVGNGPIRNKYAVEDRAFTGKNQVVTFNVRSNDIGNYFVTSNTTSGQGVVENLGSGNFRFTPNNNFTGIAQFSYRVGSGWFGPESNLDETKVYIFVGDQRPSQPLYNVVVPKNEAFVVNYKTPLSGFVFNTTQTPSNGTLVVYPGFTTQTVNGKSVSGHNLAIYTPNSGFTGNDEFELQYCLTANSSCRTAKVKVNVANINGNSCGDDCVWAGDVNNDGLVNMNDLLRLGYWMGAKGTVRQNGNSNWIGQPGDNWNVPMASGTSNLKYADTDGDGDLTGFDTLAIANNYLKTHNLQPEALPSTKGIPIELTVLTPNPVPGDFVQISLGLSTVNSPIYDFTGFSTSFNFNPEVVDTATIGLSFLPYSWANRGSSIIHMCERPWSTRLDIGYVRTGGFKVNGSGVIGTLGFVIIDDLDDFSSGSDDVFAKVTMKSPTIMDGAGNELVYPDQELKIRIPLRKGKSNFTEADVVISPNPASDRVNIYVNGNRDILESKIFNLYGQAMMVQPNILNNMAEVNTSSLISGTYFVQLQTADGSVTKKLEIIR
jgi:hypothetical protein